MILFKNLTPLSISAVYCRTQMDNRAFFMRSKKFALQNLNLSARLRQTFWPPTTVPAKSASEQDRLII